MHHNSVFLGRKGAGGGPRAGGGTVITVCLKPDCSWLFFFQPQSPQTSKMGVSLAATLTPFPLVISGRLRILQRFLPWSIATEHLPCVRFGARLWDFKHSRGLTQERTGMHPQDMNILGKCSKPDLHIPPSFCPLKPGMNGSVMSPLLNHSHTFTNLKTEPLFCGLPHFHVT